MLSDRSTATMRLMNDETNGPLRKVIVIRLSGTFDWVTTGPPGHTGQHGDSVLLVIDARTGDFLDSAIGNHEPEISTLGPVTVLYRRA